MTGTRMRPTGLGHVEVALGAGLSAVFVVLAVAVSPFVAAALVVPASMAAGRWRAHTLPSRVPHSLQLPVYSPTAVVHAPRAGASPGGHSTTTAA